MSAGAHAYTAPSRAEAEALLAVRGGELDALLARASAVRDLGLERAGRPGVITYSRKVFIPLTHLCQDRCHYCIFVQTPGKLRAAGKSPFLEPDEVLKVAREGAALGCKEALFTLGDRPENRWPIAREWLNEHGYSSTLDYVGDMARRVLEETGLLPHLNPGVMSWAEMQRLKPVGPSMGMMLETTSERLWLEKGQPHFGSPDKDPALRLRVLDDAGRSRIPFTTGVLLGIGETPADRIDAMIAIRESAAKWGHVQEVIVQNFRAKPATAMMRTDDLETQEYAAAVAVTRLVLGPDARVQTPPNLTDPNELALLLRAGIDDWGGVSPLTPDHVNPERPWPQIDELARLTALSGFRLRERLTAHPHYIRDAVAGVDDGGAPWIDPTLVPHIEALADAEGLAVEGLAPQPRRIAQPAAPVRAALTRPHVAVGSDAAVRHALARAETNPSGLSDADYRALLAARGEALDDLTSLADHLRAQAVGDTLTFVVNRNLDPTLPLSDERVGELVREAAELGATEVCLQGVPHESRAAAGFTELPQLIRAVEPRMHVHAFRPVEVVAAARQARVSPEEFYARLRDAGVGSVPGTGARILDDGIRARLSGGTELSADEWIATITAAHRAGLPSTATMVYGHLETADQQLAHLHALRRIQDETGGFTEFIAMPYVPQDVPAALVAGMAGARPGPSVRESRAVHAVARLFLHGRIEHIQVAWTKLGLAVAQQLLGGGADDAGGLLLDGALDPAAGAEAGRALTRSDLDALSGRLGRTARERTTLYELVREPVAA